MFKGYIIKNSYTIIRLKLFNNSIDYIIMKLENGIILILFNVQE